MNPTKRKELFGVLALLLTALIWGLAFSAQSLGMKHLGPCSFNALRSFIGAVALVPCIILLDVLANRRASVWGEAKTRSTRCTLLAGGACCGFFLGVASMLQQVGIQYTTTAKAGFLTALYIIIVPLLGWLILKRRVSKGLWAAVALALIGMAFLCGLTIHTGFGVGDLWLLACALGFSLQILTIDHFVKHVDCVRLACLQFLTAGLVSLPIALLAGETIVWNNLLSAWGPLLFCGILSSGVAYTLQIVGQKFVQPVIATLLMSLESVFSAVGGWLILGQTLTLREAFGCLAILAAVILAQLLPSPQPQPKSAENP